MEINEVLELVKAGYTAEEIKKMTHEGTSKPQSTEAEPKTEVEPKEVEVIGAKTEPTENKVPDFEAQIKAMTETINNLNTTVKALQENNQKTATIPANDNAPKSADEVIKGFIENM